MNASASSRPGAGVTLLDAGEVVSGVLRLVYQRAAAANLLDLGVGGVVDVLTVQRHRPPPSGQPIRAEPASRCSRHVWRRRVRPETPALGPSSACRWVSVSARPHQGCRADRGGFAPLTARGRRWGSASSRRQHSRLSRTRIEEPRSNADVSSAGRPRAAVAQRRSVRSCRGVAPTVRGRERAPLRGRRPRPAGLCLGRPGRSCGRQCRRPQPSGRHPRMHRRRLGLSARRLPPGSSTHHPIKILRSANE